jgi:exopolysaccharide biosynthesis polyprenyl glycosylphosphotransferase
MGGSVRDGKSRARTDGVTRRVGILSQVNPRGYTKVDEEGRGPVIVDASSASEEARSGPDPEVSGQQLHLASEMGPDSPIPSRSKTSRLLRRLNAGLVATDALCLLAALTLSFYFRFDTQAFGTSYSIVFLLGPVVWIGVFHAFSLYSTERLASEEEIRRVVSAVSVGMVLLVVSGFWANTAFSRVWVATTLIACLAFEIVARRVWRAYRLRLQNSDRLQLRTLVVGANAEAAEIVRTLAASGSGFAPAGQIAAGDEPVLRIDDARIVGSIDDLDELIRLYEIDCLFVASTAVDQEGMFKVLQAARSSETDLRVSAQLPGLLATRFTVQSVSEIMALSVKTPRLSGAQAFAKRVFDVSLSLMVLLISAPIWFATAIAVKATSPGPVLFRQERVTKGGRSFRMYKFRTMRSDADRLLEDHQKDKSEPFFKLGEEDPRLTRVGKFIRRASIDELPQLINVIRGEMSLIGPRPLPCDQVAANIELLGPRHEVAAGVTGWWQVHGRSDVKPEEAVQMDSFYIENWSLSLDMFILLKTAKVLVSRRGAY